MRSARSVVSTYWGSETVGGQGRLAEVLAARGGRAAPEAPFVIAEHIKACPLA